VRTLAAHNVAGIKGAHVAVKAIYLLTGIALLELASVVHCARVAVVAGSLVGHEEATQFRAAMVIRTWVSILAGERFATHADSTLASVFSGTIVAVITGVPLQSHMLAFA